MILDNDKILRVCNRLACQIVEVSDGSNKIVLVGIKEKGFEIAKIIEKQIKFFSNKKVKLYPIKIEKIFICFSIILAISKPLSLIPTSIILFDRSLSSTI